MNKRKKLFIFSSVLFLLSLLILSAAAEPDPTAPAAETPPVLLGFFVNPGSGRTEYYEGERFDPAGYTGTLTYDDGTTVTLSSDQLKYSPDGPLSADVTSVTFSCDGINATSGCPVRVIPVREFSAAALPDKTAYYACADSFDPTGLVLVIRYNDGKVSALPNTDITFACAGSAIDSLNRTVTASYSVGDRTYTVDIPLNVIRIASLRVTSQPEFTCYEGDYYPPDAVPAVEATYEDGTVMPITGFDIVNSSLPLMASAEGTAVMKVTADGVETEFTVDVLPVVNFEVLTNGAPVEYHLGDKFTPDGITVLASYGDNTVRDVTSEVVFDAPETLAADSVVTLTWNGREIPFEGIRLHAATLRVTTKPAKTEYSTGEKFDPTGMSVYATYDDGEMVKLTENDYTVIGGDPLEEKDTFVIIDWNGAQATVSVKVTSPQALIGIEISAPPASVRFVVGQPLSVDGMVVTARRQAGETTITEPLLLDSLTFIPALGTPVTEDMKEIIVAYGGFTVSQPIEAENKAAVNLVVLSRPDKTVYKEGERFDPTGLEVSMVYNDGTTVPVTGFSIDETEPFLLTSNATRSVAVSIWYNDMKCTTDVTVEPCELKNLSILAGPAKTVYKIGEKFDPTGMKVILTYADNTVEPVLLSAEDYGLAPAGALAAGDNAIYVTFRGLSAKVAIQVTQSGQPETLPPVITSVPGTSASEPVQTTRPDDPVVTADVITYDTEPEGEITRSPAITEHDPGLEDDDEKGGLSTMMILWIVILSVIVVALVILIIYYKRHFT